MTDKEFAAQKKRIQTLVAKWFGPLWLKWWVVQIDYQRELEPPGDGVNDWSTSGYTEAKWQYAKGTITFILPVIKDLSDEELEQTFVHECCHLLVAEMQQTRGVAEDDAYQGHVERTVVTLARAFTSVYQAGVDAGKKAAQKAEKAP